MPMDWTPPPKNPGGDNDFNKLVEELKSKFGGRRPKNGLLWLALAGALAIALATSSYYTVGPEETGVVQRFGAYNRESEPGLHFKLPLGIEQVTNVKTRRVEKMEFGFKTAQVAARGSFRDAGLGETALMLSGDLNVIDVRWIVQYRIRDPKKYLFSIQEPETAIWDLSQAVMRRIVGDRWADAVLTLERAEIAIQAQKELQELLDHYDTGVQVVTVKMQDVNPPDPVRSAFNEVNEARQQKERMINEAQEAYNREIPKAQGDAKRIVSEAEGYATETVNRANGEAQRFSSVLASYQKAKDVTQKRLYLEALHGMIAAASRVYVVDQSVRGLLPHLDVTAGARGKEGGK